MSLINKGDLFRTIDEEGTVTLATITEITCTHEEVYSLYFIDSTGSHWPSSRPWTEQDIKDNRLKKLK